MIDNVRIVAVEIVCERNESLVNRVVKEDDEDAFEELRVLVEDVSGRSLTSQKACELLGEHLGVDFVESEDENVDSVDEGAEYLSGFPVVNTKGERLAFLNPNSSDKIYHLVDLDEEADSDRKMRYQWELVVFLHHMHRRIQQLRCIFLKQIFQRMGYLEMVKKLGSYVKTV